MEEIKYPYNLEAERALLNAVLTDPDAAIEILEAFKAEDFYSEAHKYIFAAMMELDACNISVDMVTLTDSLQKKDYMKKVGGLAYLEGLTNEMPSTANFRNYMGIVNRDSICRKLIQASHHISELAYNCEDEKEALSAAEADIYNIAEDRDHSSLSHAAPFSAEVLNKINDAIGDPDLLKGMPSHFVNLDWKLNGLHKSDLILIAARPSMGKTAFAMNIVANVITHNSEKVVAVFSLEMSSSQLVQRILATISRTSMSDGQRGKLKPQDIKRLYDANVLVSNSKLFIDDTSMTNPMQILSKCRRLSKREGRIDLIVVDYLQLMVGGDSRSSRQEVVSDFSRRMKIVAKELNVPVILISQLSREVERRDDKTPQLSDLRESGSIEQDADIVMMLHKPSSKRRETDVELFPEYLRELRIEKHRNGAVGEIYFNWQGESLLFEPAEDPRLGLAQQYNSKDKGYSKSKTQGEPLPPPDSEAELMPATDFSGPDPAAPPEDDGKIPF